ncbi:hypothetical protein Back2_27490 [Nocardioides baekrokdamisoli]|uniref:VanZ-like domain-containing protein n=2 Tax=Nocardioides baekrokdamisoli TaxID=1804624 RepID=A0A3G9IJW4_9ACTN|nr:hypothetical protein Back2_27490 [Nocardioides baekrokdamisoli]
MSPMDGCAWFLTFSGAVTTAVVVAPFLPVLMCLLAAIRRLRGRAPGAALRTAVLDVGLIYATVVPIWLTMVPGGHPGLVVHPWTDIPTMPHDALLGNLLLLAGIGFFVPMRFRLMSSVTLTTLLAMAISCAIETCQYVLPIGRVASIDDVILNTSGAAVAAILAVPWWARRPWARSVPAHVFLPSV